MAKIDCKIAVEAAVHKSLMDSVQEIQDRYGVRINDFSADWVDVSGVNGSSHKVVNVSLSTSYSGGD